MVDFKETWGWEQISEIVFELRDHILEKLIFVRTYSEVIFVPQLEEESLQIGNAGEGKISVL